MIFNSQKHPIPLMKFEKNITRCPLIFSHVWPRLMLKFYRTNIFLCYAIFYCFFGHNEATGNKNCLYYFSSSISLFAMFDSIVVTPYILVAPKICLNISEKKEIVIKAGHKFTLDVPTQGEPVPEVQWNLGDEVRFCFQYPY